MDDLWSGFATLLADLFAKYASLVELNDANSNNEGKKVKKDIKDDLIVDIK